MKSYQVLIHASVAERLLVPTLDRGIPGSIPGRLNLQIMITLSLDTCVRVGAVISTGSRP